ncbi:MAG: hypothetical protein KAG66_08940, partial [Methylococcales bacterium]|nr:hypothetical protein [Methylococcales bacterium]
INIDKLRHYNSAAIYDGEPGFGNGRARTRTPKSQTISTQTDAPTPRPTGTRRITEGSYGVRFRNNGGRPRAIHPDSTTSSGRQEEEEDENFFSFHHDTASGHSTPRLYPQIPDWAEYDTTPSAPPAKGTQTQHGSYDPLARPISATPLYISTPEPAANITDHITGRQRGRPRGRSTPRGAARRLTEVQQDLQSPQPADPRTAKPAHSMFTRSRSASRGRGTTASPPPAETSSGQPDRNLPLEPTSPAKPYRDAQQQPTAKKSSGSIKPSGSISKLREIFKTVKD